MCKIIPLFVLYLILAKCSAGDVKGVKLLDSDMYIRNVTQQFIYELEDYGVCNTKLEDMTQKIFRVGFFGYDTVGSIYYTNGFLNTFQQVSYAADPQMAIIDVEQNSVHMSSKLIFSSLMMFYDYRAVLSAGKFTGTVAVPMNTMSIEINVHKFYNNDALIHDVEITGWQSAISVKWFYEPSNHYTEIINKEVLLDFEKSKENIEKLWDKLLDRAIRKFPFPVMCFMCN